MRLESFAVPAGEVAGYGGEAVSAKPLLSPGWYAVGAFVAVPFLAVVLLIAAAVFLVLWPIVPFWCYCQRREQLHAMKVDDRIAQMVAGGAL